jgi:hypothetical protein
MPAMAGLSTGSIGRRPKSAKAGNRGVWGTNGAAGAMGIWRRRDEQKGSWLTFGLRKLPGTKAIMHKSVYKRFAAGPVVLFDEVGQYLPKNMNQHVDFVQYFDPNNTDPQPANPAAELADDIEAKWEAKIRKNGPASNREVI